MKCSQMCHCDNYFDYWGKGTQVTVSSAQASVPTSLFPLSQCGSDSGYVTLGCVTAEFLPANSVTFKWKDASGSELSDFIQYPDFQVNGKYSKVSQIKIKDSDWEAKKSYTCEVEYPNGNKKATLIKPVEQLRLPSLYLMLPSEEEGLQNQTSTFVCLARDFAPQSHKFHWVYNGNYLPGESSGEQKGSDGNYTASSYLVVSHASWASAGAVRCEFEHKSGNLTKEAWQAPLSAELTPPSQRELFLNNKIVLKCIITGADSAAVKGAQVTWKVAGKEPNSQTTLSAAESLKNGKSRRVSSLEVEMADWFSGSVVECQVSDPRYGMLKASPLTTSIKKSDGGDPEVIIYTLPDSKVASQEESVVCEVRGPSLGDVYIMWRVDGGNYMEGNSGNLKRDNGNESVVSILTVPSESVTEATLFTCAVKYSGMENYTAPRVEQHSKTQLSVELTPPSQRELFLNNKIVLKCIITGADSAAVKGAQVTWKVAGKEPSSQATLENGESRKVSSLEVEMANWFSGSVVECQVSDPRKGVVKDSSLMKSIKKIDGGDPEVIIYTLPDSKVASQEESVVCEVRGPSLGDVYIMWRVDGGNYMEGNSGHLKRDNGNESVVSILTVPSESVREATLFNCAVKYGGMKDHTTPYLKKYSKTTETPSAPTVTVLQRPGQLVCLVSDFSPSAIKITWLKNGMRIDEEGPDHGPGQSISTAQVSKGHDRKFSTHSHLNLTSGDWDSGMRFTCLVTHVTGELSRNISKPAPLSVELTPPSQRDIFLNNKIVLKCIITGADSAAVKGAQVTWKVAGKDPSSQATLENGESRKVSSLEVEMADWFSGSVVECQVSDPREGVVKDGPLTTSIKKSDGGDPEVIIYTLPDSKVASQEESVVCEVRGPSLGDVYIMWQVDGGNYMEGNSGHLKHVNGNESVVSILSVKSENVTEATLFTCAVKYAGMENYTAPRVEQHSKTTETPSAPTVTVLQRPGQLVCLVSDFSPSAIKITWLKNGMRIDEEGPDHGPGQSISTAQVSKGHDRKFSTHSHLNLTSGDWDSGMRFTCLVKHVTGEVSRNISKPEPQNEVLFHDDNMADAVTEDTIAETLNMAWAFLFLFLFSLLYGCTVTLIKVK
ncbi:hemicentin-2 isoform X2 [Engraulis encrasicolus]|uniref:hemicentin-2 isoform X2 n=1 Tax=Engraulis encrasicolus TaxID=184585 RepID=UPI002FD41700